MQLDPLHYDVTLDAFLDSWNLDRIKTMTIDEYADLSNHDSLCYWLEYGTKNLGAIGAISLNKFELWKPRFVDGKEFKDGRFTMEKGYAYNAWKGSTLEDAFENIRNLVAEIVQNSLDANWSAIDGIKFHAIGKWKLAFLFSGKRLLPVYSMRALQAIATGLGHTFTDKDKIWTIQSAIIGHKEANDDMVNFSYNVYSQFARKKKDTGRSYFIVGSKYSDENGNDTLSVMDDFLKHRCIAIGWLDWLDFGSYMGVSHGTVNQFVEDHWDSETPKVGKIKAYFRHLSRMKPGDIIAIKSHGAYGQLTIIAYAEVVERDGQVYWHDDEILGHHINVEFLDAGFVHETGETYAGTVHELTAEKDGEKFYNVFGWHASDGYDEIPEKDFEKPYEDFGEEPGEQGYNEKNEDSFERSAVASVIVNRVHNRIQNRFVRYLEATFPEDLCSGEKKYIDAKRISAEEITIYEIKPFASPYWCIREGIGQLLDYMHKEKSGKKKRIVIVGPNEPKHYDLEFLQEIRNILNVRFSYMAFDESKGTANEY